MSRATLRLSVAALVIHLALILPTQPMPATQALARLAPELPLLLALLCLAGPLARLAVTAGLWLLVMQKLASLAMMATLGRAFNPVADLPLIDASLRLVAGSFGTAAAVGAAAGAVLVAVAVLVLLWWAAGVWSRPGWSARQRMVAALLAGLALTPALTGAVRAENGVYARDRYLLARRTLGDLRQLRQLASTDPFLARRPAFGAIDRDVLVIFIESYGRASFDVAFHAERHLPSLRAAEARLAAAGLSMRSGFLVAPTRGGQSWLSHASFANGLWIDDQARFQAVLASGRQGLFHHAGRAGFATAAVMPAITRPWPEAAAMGFQRVLAAGDLGYRGKPFNWVTMPDQFTLLATDRLLRDGPADRPRLFAQIALISSHAPWVPVPRLLDWDAITDGTEFDAMAEAGDPPRVVWQDRERVRRQYRDAVDYALETVADYALRHAADPPLLMVLGDHQAAASIALDEGRDVAMHVIGPEALVRRAEGWGFGPGLIPPQGSAAIPMDRLRDLILGGFDSDEAPA